MPLIIGITGSIATGKSSAAQILVNHGAVHCDADRLVHRMYDPGKPAFDRIVSIFGQEIVGDNGYIDRKILGSKVFGKPEEMRKLTTAIGDIAAAVKEVVDEWNDTLARDDIAILEAVNLIEAGYGQWCNAVWLFAASDDIARQRLMARNQFSEEEANQRLASQRKWEERAPASDLIIQNDDGLQEFQERVQIEFNSVLELWRKSELTPTKYLDWWRNQYS